MSQLQKITLALPTWCQELFLQDLSSWSATRTDVTYHFVDPSGNNADCTFTVIVNEGKLEENLGYLSDVFVSQP